MSQASFLKALGLSQSQWENMKTQVPQAQGAIHWLIKSGKLPAEKYFSWAKEEYGCAVLKSDYFSTPDAAAIHKKFQLNADTPKDKVPVAEWDGVVFYAGVVPPESGATVGFFLAHPKDLETFCLLKQATVAVSAAVAVAAPALAMPAPQELPELPELPEMPSESVSDSSLKLGADDVPEGLVNFAALQKSDSVPTIEGLIDLTADEVATRPAIPLNEVSETGEAPEGLVLSVSTETKAKPVENNVLKIVAAEVPTSKPSAVQDTQYSSALQAALPVFGECILFSYDGTNLVPKSWSNNFMPAKPAGPKNLIEPSAFRIVLRTKQPYLGHLVATEVNKDFITAWFGGKGPEKVLVQPILQNQNLIGAFMAVCPKDCNNQQVLTQGSDLAVQIAKYIQSRSAAA